MASTHSHDAHLTAANGRSDPTRTKTVRETYARRLRGAFGRINTVIREAVGERDILGVRDRSEIDDLRLSADVSSPRDLSNLPPAETMRRFRDWLRRAQENEVLTVIEENENVFIRRAYERALKDAEVNLRQAGVVGDDVGGVAAALEKPIHQRKLQTLFARNFAELEGITNEVSRQVQRVLADGLSEGLGPEDIAESMTDRVDKIGKTRATVMARTEVINAHAESTLTRYEEFSEVSGVTIRSEWSTAGDQRVCPICFSLEGEVFTIEEARTASFRYDAGEDEPASRSGEYPVKPPLHPQCRCVLLPVTGSAAAAAVARHPTAYHTLLASGWFCRGGEYERLAEADESEAAQLVAAAG